MFLTLESAKWLLQNVVNILHSYLFTIYTSHCCLQDLHVDPFQFTSKSWHKCFLFTLTVYSNTFLCFPNSTLKSVGLPVGSVWTLSNIQSYEFKGTWKAKHFCQIFVFSANEKLRFLLNSHMWYTCYYTWSTWSS